MREDSLKNDPWVLIDLAKKGDKKAFDLLYEIYFVPVFRYVFSRTNSETEAEDLVQEIFLNVYRNIDKIQNQKDSPLAYFFKVARNLIIDYWRKKKEILIDKEEKLASNQDFDLFETLEKKERIDLIKKLIKELNEDQQEVVIHKFFNGMSNREIAKLLGKTEEAVRQLQSRALKNLREKLKNLKIL
jgi:RNA polymerase sigma-70 factor (ECF subfamily)